MAQDFSQFKSASTGAIEWLKKEYSTLNTGRAMPALLDSIKVNSYGSMVAINQVGTISIEDPRILRIVPWDKAVSKNIDAAIRESDLGVSVALDASGVRISFPALTSDRREILKKLAKEKLEEARIKLRNERQKALAEIEKAASGEDEKKRLKNELQKLVDEANKKLEELAERKNKEILE